MKDKKKLYRNWADLVDLGFEFSLANLRKKYRKDRALKEIKTILARQSEEHWRSIIKVFKILK